MNIAGGDWRFFFPENITSFIGIPSAWDASLNTGVGQPQLNTLWITGYLYLTSLLSKIGFSWNAISLVCWIIPVFLIGSISMFFLYRFFWQGNKNYAVISSLIYISNTYFLMIFSGGQLGVALAYSTMPLVLYRFLKNLKTPSLYNSIFFGAVFSLHLLFDPRLAFITSILLFIFLFVENSKSFFRAFKYTIFLPLSFVALTHGYWVVPIAFFYLGATVEPSIYKATNDFSFFSFAKLENTMALLHPNWPENIFGRVHFMRPEFILIPLLAFVSIFKKTKKTKKIIIVVFVSLVFIFLAKGVNDPFGILYLLFLKHIPGFSMFRDPTKFYIPIALCYALLIPIGLQYIVSILSKIKKIKKHSNSIVYISFILFWIALSIPLFQGKVNGIFKLRAVSSDYMNYKNFILQQPEFYRVLWVPQIQRFGYFDNNHPAIGRGELFKDQSLKGMLKELADPTMEQRLSSLSVQYVVVPNDTEGEIFVDDGKFDKKQYDLAVNKLEKISYLTREKNFGSIVVFKTRKYKSHFSFAKENSSGRIKILSNSPNQYKLAILPSSHDLLVFGDSFDPNWEVKTSYGIVKSKNYNGLNSFEIEKAGDYIVEISYQPQKIVNIFSIVSLLTFFLTVGYIIIFSKKRK